VTSLSAFSTGLQRLLCAAGLALLLLIPATFGTAEEPPRGRVLLVPLDDRPPCLQWPVLMGRVADLEVVAPPRDLLGSFTIPGDPEKIADWILAQDLATFDAAILSFDMIAFGGLVASRVPDVEKQIALKHLEILQQMRSRAPDLPLYGSSVIMRLAPTADGTNEGWRRQVERWAEVSVDSGKAEETARLERAIPAEALARYQKARERNLAVNQAAVRLAAEGVLDYLLLSQDDAKPEGLHVSEQAQLLQQIATAGLAERAVVQPGADEVSMLLISRFASTRFQAKPGIEVIYSSDESRQAVAPFEDVPLHRTVSQQIASAGAHEVSREGADLLFFVYASRLEAPDRAERFAEQIAEAINGGRAVIVADIDTGGRVQGAHIPFAEALRERDLLSRLHGYASWNTAGNTIGTALPHGFLRWIARHERFGESLRVEDAQQRFLLHRFINDYLYHAVIRPQINREPAELRERLLLEKLPPLAADLLPSFGLRPPFAAFHVYLPWKRTFEAEIDFHLQPPDTTGPR